MDNNFTNNLSETQHNIFKDIQHFFDIIPLINVEYQTTALEIPWMYQEDGGRYVAYLNNWLDRNQETFEAWKALEAGDYVDTGKL